MSGSLNISGSVGIPSPYENFAKHDEILTEQCKKNGIPKELMLQCMAFAQEVLNTEGSVDIDKPLNCISVNVAKQKGEVTFKFHECVEGGFKKADLLREVTILGNGTFSVKNKSFISRKDPGDCKELAGAHHGEVKPLNKIFHMGGFRDEFRGRN